MTEEAEKAAKWDMLQEIKKQRSHLAVLQERTEQIGNSLHTFGRVFTNPDWVFTRKGSSIAGKSTVHEGRDATFEIPLANFDVEEICQLIGDLAKTQVRIKTLEMRVGEIS